MFAYLDRVRPSKDASSLQNREYMVVEVLDLGQKLRIMPYEEASRILKHDPAAFSQPTAKFAGSIVSQSHLVAARATDETLPHITKVRIFQHGLTLSQMAHLDVVVRFIDEVYPFDLKWIDSPESIQGIIGPEYKKSRVFVKIDRLTRQLLVAVPSSVDSKGVAELVQLLRDRFSDNQLRKTLLKDLVTQLQTFVVDQYKNDRFGIETSYDENSLTGCFRLRVSYPVGKAKYKAQLMADEMKMVMSVARNLIGSRDRFCDFPGVSIDDMFKSGDKDLNTGFVYTVGFQF